MELVKHIQRVSQNKSKSAALFQDELNIHGQ